MSPFLKAFLFLYLSATVAFAALVFFYTRNLEPQTVSVPRDQRPDIRHCFADDVDLWDCIRHKETDK